MGTCDEDTDGTVGRAASRARELAEGALGTTAQDTDVRRRDMAAIMCSPRFRAEMASSDVRACLVIAVALVALGLVGLLATAFPWATGDLFDAVPAELVYAAIAAAGALECVALATVWGARGSAHPRRALAICRLCLVVDALLSALTLLGTQVGTGYYVELALMMMGVAVLPIYTPLMGAVTVAASAVPLCVVCYLAGFVPLWQDAYDLVLFYALCLVSMSFRRLWYVRRFQAEERLRQTNSRLYRRTRTDTLTGLGSREAFQEDLPQLAVGQLCVALVDLDGFKLLNDRLGHEEGDRRLRRVADLLAAAFQGTPASLYRYGGDEFLVLAPDLSVASFLDCVEAFSRSLLAEPGMAEETASVGYCWGQADTERAVRACISEADNCLFDAKAERPGSVRGTQLGAASNRGRDGGHDRLTGLLNREAFDRRLASLDTSRPGWSVVALDVDHFQLINKELGYATGDSILVEVARLLGEAFPGSPIARSDDHFQVFTTLADVDARIRQVQYGIAAFCDHLFLFLRAGVYQADTAERACPTRQAADMAKYACDELRGQSVVTIRHYDEALDRRREDAAFVQGHFKEALRQGHIKPYFQPLVGALSGHTAGFEALARWEDPDRGLVSPGAFVPALERSHESYLLDLHILRCVCQLLSSLDAGRLANLLFSVNLSRTDFEVIDVPLRVDQIVSGYGVPRSALRLEITESAFVDSQRIRDDIQRLRDLGYGVWLDDFGSGVSSMNVLKDYAVDAAKLDMEFVRSAETSERARLIIQSTVRLCHEIGMTVIVEGVETERQLGFIRNVGGNIIQGFYYSRPLDEASLRQSDFWKLYSQRPEILFYRVAANVRMTYLASEGDVSQERVVVLEREGRRVRVLRADQRVRPCLGRLGLSGEWGDWVSLASGVAPVAADLVGRCDRVSLGQDEWARGDLCDRACYLGAATLARLEGTGRSIVRLKLVPTPQLG